MKPDDLTWNVGCSPYLHDALVPEHRANNIRRAVETLTKHEFDAIAVSGVSGLTMGSIVSFQLNKPLIVVRKDYEVTDHHSHSTLKVEGPDRIDSFVIFDDCISSGNTVKRIDQAIFARYAKVLNLVHPKLVGVYTYAYPTFPGYMDELFPGRGVLSLNSD